MSATSALEALARDAKRFADDWPRDGARVVEDEARRQLYRDTGDGRFSRSRMGRGQVVVRASSGSADVQARGGVWTWLEDGTRAHETRARAGKVLRTPYGPRPAVRVRGMSARHTWTRAVTASMPQVSRDADQAFGRMVT